MNNDLAEKRLATASGFTASRKTGLFFASYFSVVKPLTILVLLAFTLLKMIKSSKLGAMPVWLQPMQ